MDDPVRAVVPDRGYEPVRVEDVALDVGELSLHVSQEDGVPVARVDDRLRPYLREAAGHERPQAPHSTRYKYCHRKPPQTHVNSHDAPTRRTGPSDVTQTVSPGPMMPTSLRHAGSCISMFVANTMFSAITTDRTPPAGASFRSRPFGS